MDYVIRVVSNDGEFLQITDLQNRYKGKIHKSLIKTEQFNLFYPNIPLFVEEKNRQMILSNPKYYSIVAPEPFFGMMYFSSVRSAKVTLGELLQIWENEPVFSIACKKCGGKSVIYRFGGSPLSGTMFETKNICVECGSMGNGADHNFGVLRSTRLNYKPIEPIAEKPDTIESLIETCKSKWEV